MAVFTHTIGCGVQITDIVRRQGMREGIRKVIEESISSFRETEGVNLWRTPIIGYVPADHPEIRRFKELVSPTHAMPRDILPESKTVIVYFIPFEPEVVESNREGNVASSLWAQAYVLTNHLIIETGKRLEDWLVQQGVPTRALPPTHNFNRETLLSDWSHRHFAYLAGLGTFGLNNMLITREGCCGRFGSLLTAIEIESGYVPVQDACLYHRNGSCKLCLSRCPTQALKEDGFDRHRCYKLCQANARRYETVGSAEVCGKCLIGLPCSQTLPE